MHPFSLFHRLRKLFIEPPEVCHELQPLEPRLLLSADFSWAPLNEPGVGGQVTSVSVSPFDSDRVLIGGDLLGIGVSADGGDSWLQTIGLTGGGQAVEQFTWIDANTVWVGTQRGPYKSTDGGVTWTSKRSGFPSFIGLGMTAPVQKILQDPNNDSRLLAFIGNFRRIGSSNGYTNLGEVWESTDSGENWSQKSTIVSGRHVEQAVYKDNNTIYAVADGKFYRSSDDGASWTQYGAGLTGFAKWVTKSPTSNNTVWVATSSDGVFKSTDSGANFTQVSSGLASGGSGRAVVEVDQVTTDGRDVLYYIYANGMYRSNDGGGSWTDVVSGNLSGSAYQNEIIEKIGNFDPSNADRFFFGNNNSLWRTENNATDWTVTTSQSVGNGYYIGTGYSGLVAEDFFFNPFNPNESATAALDAGKWFSSDDLQTWKFAKGGLNMGVERFWASQEVVFTDTTGSNQVIYMAQGQFGADTKLYRTTNGGASWTTRSLPPGTSGDIKDLYVHPTNTNTVWMVRSNKLYQSTDGGSNWTQLTSGLSGNILTIAADAVNAPNTIYAGTSTGVYKSTNGTAFTSLDYPRNGVTEIVIDPVKLDRIYVINRNDSNSFERSVRRYDGDTDNWTTIVKEGNSSIKSINDVAIDPLDNTRIFVSTDQDPFKSNTNESGVWLKEGSAAFVQVNDGLRNLRVQSLTFKPGTSKLVAGTNGSGYYIAETGAVATPDNLEVQVAGNSQTLADITSYSDQDLSGGFTIEDGGSTIKLTGNAWKKAAINYNVTADTVLKFDYKSTDEGEIQGIGLDDDNIHDEAHNFKLYGTQNWGITDFNDYSGSDFKTYTIDVGSYFTGNISYLTFVNDGDSNTGDSFFRNIELFEDTAGNGAALVNDDFNSTGTGGVPVGWSRDQDGGSVGVLEFPSASDKSLKLVDTKSFDSVSAARNFEAAGGVVTAEFRFRQSDQDPWTRLRLQSGGVVAVDLRTYNGNIAINGNNGVTTGLLNYASNTWYDIKIVADTDADTFDVFIDGVPEAADVAFRNNVASLDRFHTNTGTAAVTSVWIDDLVITEGTPVSALPGDYDGNLSVGQEDLDLVLQFWGTSVTDGQSPGGAWTNAATVTGSLIGQDELALVLQNWGNIAAVESQFITTPAVPLVQDDFSAISTRSIPTGWTRGTRGGSVGVVELPSTANKSLQINDWRSYGGSFAQRRFDPASGLVTTRFKFQQSDRDNWTRLQLRSGSTIAIDLRTKGGNLVVNGTQATTSLINFTSKTWYDLRIVADTVADTFDVFINGVSVATNVAFKSSVASLDRFHVNTGTASKTKVWIDDLSIVS